MAVTIKSAKEIELMREAGRILATVHDSLAKMIQPGISTEEIDREGERIIRDFGCVPSFLGLYDFPASICVSVNEEVVHGIPSRKRILKDGDIVSLDAGVLYKGYHSDAARTHGVGQIDDRAAQLIEVTKNAFYAGIQQAKPGNHLHDISAAIGEYAESRGYGVVRELVGHGIGTQVHEDPQVPNFKQKSKGIELKPGMTLAIEPMINAGTRNVFWLDDEWTVVTEDGQKSAHYENTILITETGCEILSLIE